MKRSAEPLLSVDTPSNNYAGVLSRAVDSVLSQATPEVELWVVDDGSSDDTPALLGDVDADTVSRMTAISDEIVSHVPRADNLFGRVG